VPRVIGISQHGNTDGAAVGGSKFAGAASKVAGAPLGSCRFVSMDATAKPSFSYGIRLGIWGRYRAICEEGEKGGGLGFQVQGS
jgi:hypothetical protein